MEKINPTYLVVDKKQCVIESKKINSELLELLGLRIKEVFISSQDTLKHIEIGTRYNINPILKDIGLFDLIYICTYTEYCLNGILDIPTNLNMEGLKC
jgi:hypothetical protein